MPDTFVDFLGIPYWVWLGFAPIALVGCSFGWILLAMRGARLTSLQLTALGISIQVRTSSSARERADDVKSRKEANEV